MKALRLSLMVCLVSVLTACGATHTDLASGSTSAGISSAAFFAYPYSAKPTYFSDLALFVPAGAPPGLNEFTVIATIRNVGDLTASTAYQIDVTAPDGTVLCPTHSGSVSPAQTTVSVKCVSKVPSSPVKVVLTIAPDAQAQVITKTF